MTELNGQPIGPDAAAPAAPAARPQPSLAMTRAFGVALILGSFVVAYFTMYRPLQEARQTGQLEYYLKGILLPPGLLYMGLAMLVSDFRDGQLRTVNAAGKVTFTRKGWIFFIGLLAVLGLTMLAWHLYVKSIGFSGAF